MGATERCMLRRMCGHTIKDQIWNELIDGVQVDMGGGDKKELQGWK
jgi:hypothetical protein